MPTYPADEPGTDELLRFKLRWEDLEAWGGFSPNHMPSDPAIAAPYISWLDFKVHREGRTLARTNKEYDGLESVEKYALAHGFQPLHSMIRHDPRPLTGPDQSHKRQPDAGWTSLPGSSSSSTSTSSPAPATLDHEEEHEEHEEHESEGPSRLTIAAAGGVLLGLAVLAWRVLRRL